MLTITHQATPSKHPLPFSYHLKFIPERSGNSFQMGPMKLKFQAEYWGQVTKTQQVSNSQYFLLVRQHHNSIFWSKGRIHHTPGNKNTNGSQIRRHDAMLSIMGFTLVQVGARCTFKTSTLICQKTRLRIQEKCSLMWITFDVKN